MFKTRWRIQRTFLFSFSDTSSRHACGIGLLLATCLLLAGCGPLTFVVGVTPGDQTIEETMVQRESTSQGQKVAIVDISGVLLNARRPGLLKEGEHPVAMLNEMLTRAANDRNVRAVILRMNTPGGTVTASDAMYREVLRFREQTNKPVIALMMDVTASGGYYVACAADEMIAYPTSITGSIGVIMQTVSLQRALNSIGIQTVAIKSGDNKAAGSLLEDLTPSQREVFEQLVETFYEKFVELVERRRPEIAQENLAMVTDGRIVSGIEAHALGMVDATGDLYDAFGRAKELASLSAANLVVYHRPLNYVGSPYAHADHPAHSGTQINMMQLNMTGLPAGGDMLTGFYYLWLPDLP